MKQAHGIPGQLSRGGLKISKRSARRSKALRHNNSLNPTRGSVALINIPAVSVGGCSRGRVNSALYRFAKLEDTFMANVKEFDFRRDWVSLTLSALQTGFARIKEMGDEMPWFDGLCQLEHADNIFGIAFVTAQTYILGTVEDVNSIRKAAGKSELDKIKYYDDDKFPMSNGDSRILFINAIANHFKHRDERNKGWGKNLTTITLYDAGIDENTEFGSGSV